jgi:hypothetical protein
MRLTPNLRRNGGTHTLLSTLFLSLTLACSRGEQPAVVQASLLTMVLLGGPLLVIAVAALALLRRRRGPQPLSRMLIAGSLRDMQGPRPYRRPTRP